MGRLLAITLVLCAGAESARADDGVRVVDEHGGSVRQARVGEPVTLRAVLVERGRTRELPDGARVRWARVAPHMQHEDTPPPNAGIAQYSNSVLFGPAHGRWIGLDRVEYQSRPLETAERGRSLTLRGSPDRADRAGTLWISAEVTLPDGRVLRAPDHDDVDELGLSPRVMRVSFRTDDTALGWLSTYFGVPNIFGSTRGQAERYVGADCADVLVGAARASGKRELRYTSVTGIHRDAEPVTEALVLTADGRVTDAGGRPVEVRWGDDVRPGDLFAIDYADPDSRLPRAWDHIGALVRDGDGDGVLGAGDVLRHMVPVGLVDWPLGPEAPIRFRVWRFRAR